jgi:hypothetical protein
MNEPNMSQMSQWFPSSDVRLEYSAHVAFGDTHNPGKFIVIHRIVQVSRSFEYESKREPY